MSGKPRLKVDEATSKDVYNSAIKLLAETGRYFIDEEKQINEIIFVPQAIMSRILRTHDAITLLLKKGTTPRLQFSC